MGDIVFKVYRFLKSKLTNKMQIKLDNAFDAHFIYVEDSQDNTLNIIVRIVLDESILDSNINEALHNLILKHPYLNGKVTENHCDTAFPFSLTITRSLNITSNIKDVNDKQIDNIICSISEMRFYRFYTRKEPLIKVNIWKSDSRTLIELCCPHLLTDLQGGVILMGDFCNFLDLSISGDDTHILPCKRLIFDEVRYGWRQQASSIQALKIPPFHKDSTQQWQKPNSQYQRNYLHLHDYYQLKNWLEDNEIQAKVVDLLYYVVNKIYKTNYDIELSLLTTFGFRQLLSEENEQKNINTSAVFFPIDMSDYKAETYKYWMENFYFKRNSKMTKEGVLQVINYFRSINKSMNCFDSLYNRQVINQIKKMGATFLINNIGSLDKFFNSYKHFNIVDIDIQDGVPGEELRMFGFKDKVYLNPMFKRSSPLSSNNFYSLFIDEINNLTGLSL